jgi:hypothetical protein
MNLAVVLFTAITLVGGLVAPAAAQSDRNPLGGVLDTLGGILGGGTQKLHGTVVLVKDTTMVLRTDDQRSYRIDLASIDPQARQGLQPGQTANVTVRGGGQANVLTASELQVDQSSTPRQFQQVTGTVEGGGNASRLVFRTRDGLALPVDVSQIRGLPFFSSNQPATLIYEQGPQQQIVAVWIEPGDGAAAGTGGMPQPSASPSSSAPIGAPQGTGQTVQGMVNSLGLNTLSLQTSDGRTMSVDTAGVDRQALQSVRPGDIVTVTGQAAAQDRFVAQSIRTDNPAR